MTSPKLIRILLATMAPAFAATLPYQGILTDDKGVPVADGPKEISFTVYGQSTGGSALWTEPRVATTRKGLFSLEVGAATSLPDSLFQRDSLFLEVKVSGTALSPRTPLGTSPWAFRSRKADTAKYALEVQGLGAKVDTATLTTRLAGYAPSTALASYAKATDLAAYAKSTDLSGYATTTSLANYAPVTSLASYAKTTDLASYAKTTDLSSYVKTTALASYATTAAVNGKMNTADYVESAHLKALGGLSGGRGFTGAFNGSEILLDTTQLRFASGGYGVKIDYDMLAWSQDYNQWRIDAIPGGAFSLVMGTRAFDMTMMTVTNTGTTFGGDVSVSGNLQAAGNVNIDGTLSLKTAAVVVPDYVFESDYKLASLSEVEAYTQANKHLPEVPSAKELEAGGIDLAKMNLLLLKKVEELTLHAIAQEKEIQAQKQRLQTLEERLQ